LAQDSHLICPVEDRDTAFLRDSQARRRLSRTTHCQLGISPYPEDLLTIRHRTPVVKEQHILYNDCMANDPKSVAKLFIRKKWTLSIAESCTGGLITHSLTNIPGSSRYIRGGIIAYANALKRNVLNVTAETIKRHGAVSQETAIEMAQGMRRLSRSRAALAITGIAGPGGGSATKPVGTVFISCAVGRHVYFKKFRFAGSRRTVKEKARQAALHFLLKCCA